MRESNALELQQSALAKMSRVGVMAALPATFKVRFSACFASVDANPSAVYLNLPLAEEHGAICFSGRDAEGEEYCRLTLSEDLIDELLGAISAIDDTHVHQRAREPVKRLKSSFVLGANLEKGIDIPTPNNSTPIVISASVGDPPKKEVFYEIVRNPKDKKKPWNQYKNGLVLVLSDDVAAGDKPEGDAPVQEEAAAEAVLAETATEQQPAEEVQRAGAQG